MSKAKDIGGGYKGSNRSLRLGDLGSKVCLAPIGIGNEYGIDSCGKGLNVLRRGTVIPYIGIWSYSSKDRKINGSGVLRKTEHIGIHRYHRERRSRLGYIGGIGSNTSYGIGNGVGIGTRDKVKDIFGGSAIGPGIGEGRVRTYYGNLHGSITSSKARDISNNGSHYGTLRGLINGKGIGN